MNKIYCILLCLFSVSCAGLGSKVKLEGYSAEIECAQSKNYKGELLFVDTTSIRLLEPNCNQYDEFVGSYSFRDINIDSVVSISIPGFANYSWVWGVGILELAPSVAIAATNPTFLYPLGYTALNAGMFSLATPANPYYEKDALKNKEKLIQALNKYSRYPFPLNAEQLKMLLSHYTVKNINESN